MVVEEKKFTIWQIVNLKMKIQVKPAKVVCSALILQIAVYPTVMQYIHGTLLTQYTQPKYRDLSTNNRTDVEHFCENIIYPYPTIRIYFSVNTMIEI